MSRYAYGSNPGAPLNIRLATQEPWRGLLATLNGIPYLVIDKEGDTYTLEGVDGDIQKLQSFYWQPATENSRLIAASRLEGSPLARGRKVGDWQVGTLVWDNEWFVRNETTDELLPIYDMVDYFDDEGWTKDTAKKVSAIQGEFTHQIFNEPVKFHSVDHTAGGDGAPETWVLQGDDGQSYYLNSDSTISDSTGVTVGSFDPYASNDWDQPKGPRVDDPSAGGFPFGSPSSPRHMSAMPEEHQDALVCPNCGGHTLRSFDEEGSELGCLTCGNTFKTKEAMRGTPERQTAFDIFMSDFIKAIGYTRIDYNTNRRLIDFATERMRDYSTNAAGTVPHKALESDSYNAALQGMAQEWKDQMLAEGEHDPKAPTPTYEDEMGYDPWADEDDEAMNRKIVAPDYLPWGEEEQNYYRKGPGFRAKVADEGYGFDGGGAEEFMDYENGEFDEEQEVRHMQKMVNDGLWGLQGSHGRAMMDAINAGYVALGPNSARDYYGNHIPSRFEVEPGSKGSVEYVVERSPFGAVLDPPSVDEPGATTLEDMGVPPEGEEYYRDAAVKEGVSWDFNAPMVQQMPAFACSHCGGRVDGETGWCEDCRYQYMPEDLAKLPPFTPEQYTNPLLGLPQQMPRGANKEASATANERGDMKTAADQFPPGTRVQIERQEMKGQRGSILKHVGRENNFDDNLYDIQLDNGEKLEKVPESAFKRIKSAQVQNENLPDSTQRHFLGSQVFSVEGPEVPHYPENKTPQDYDPPAQDGLLEPEEQEVECPMCHGSASKKGELGAREYYQCGSCGTEWSWPNQSESEKWGIDDPADLFGADGPGQLPTESKASAYNDSAGTPLKPGGFYTMHHKDYKVPDVVRILNLADTRIEAAIESDVAGAFPIVIEDAEGYSFEPYTEPADSIQSESGWKLARRNFSPKEQKDLIDENPKGRARNYDKLNIEGTHYVLKSEANDPDFLLGS